MQSNEKKSTYAILVAVFEICFCDNYPYRPQSLLRHYLLIQHKKPVKIKVATPHQGSHLHIQSFTAGFIAAEANGQP